MNRIIVLEIHYIRPFDDNRNAILHGRTLRPMSTYLYSYDRPQNRFGTDAVKDQKQHHLKENRRRNRNIAAIAVLVFDPFVNKVKVDVSFNFS